MNTEVSVLQFKLCMAYTLSEDQLCLRVKSITPIVLLDVINWSADVASIKRGNADWIDCVTFAAKGGRLTDRQIE